MADEITLGLDSSVNDANELNKRLEETIRLIKNAQKESNKFRLADSVKGFKGFDEGTSKSINDIKNSYDRLVTSKNRLNQQSAKEIVNQRALSRSADLEARATSKLVGAYQNLNAKRLQSKKRLQDLIASEKASARQIKVAQKEYDKLTAKVNKANKATSNFSNTSLGKMSRGFKNLLGGFGLVLGVQLLGDFTRAVFNNIKELDKLDYTLKSVIATEGEYARTRAFLNDISIRFGAEIVSTTERYTKFMVAAKQSGVALKETEKIFRTVTKASAVLGLKTDELNGVYLALEQMLSKGKVTTEELRRQLGERLPGAFGIMADALGVTTSELDKMLKKGEILSSEALPKFAEELEKAIGVKQVNTVVTLQTAWNNLSNSWLSFLDNLRRGQSWITESLIVSFQLLSKAVREVGDQFLSEEQKEYNKVLADTFKELQDGEVPLERASKSLENFNKIRREALELNDFEGINKPALEATIKAYQDYIKSIKNKNEEEEESINKGRTLSDVLKEIKDAQNELTNSTKDEAPVVLERIRLLEEEKKAWERLDAFKSRPKDLTSVLALETEDGTGSEIEAMARMKKAIDAQIESVKELLEYTPKWSKEYEALTSQLENLENAFNGLDVSGANAEIDSFIENFKEQQKLIVDIKRDYAEQRISIERDISDNLKELGLSLSDSLAEIELQRLDKQYEESEKKADKAIEFANGNAAAEAKIQSDLANEKERIVNKQEKIEKRAFLIQQAFAAGEIAIDTIKTVAQLKSQAAILAANPVTAPLASLALGQIPLVVTSGALAGAAIVAQSIPAFKDGVENFGGGTAIVGDGGVSEYVKTPDGQYFKTPATDTLVNLPKGSDVLKNEDEFMKDLSKITDFNGILFNNKAFDLGNLVPSINIEQKGVTAKEMDNIIAKYIGSQPKEVTEFDNGKFVKYVKNGYSSTKSHNDRVTFKGKSV